MKIDIIIGNPPYQDTNGKSSIYSDFIDKSLEISNIVCMITKDNWLTGSSFTDLRNRLSSKGNIKNVTHYPIIYEIFYNVRVAVAYFMWIKGYKGNTLYRHIEKGKDISSRNIDINNFVLSDIAESIINKIDTIDEWNKQFNVRSYPFMDRRKRLEKLDTSEIKDQYHNIEVIIHKEESVYTNIEYFTNKEEVINYNVMCGVTINEAQENLPSKVITNIIMIKPYQVTSESWSIVATFDNEIEANNCKKYIQTKFFRFLANLTVSNRAALTKNAFRFIPLQDFTQNSDINWDKTIDNIDKQLYEKYNINENEIEYINKLIKTID